MQCGRLREDTVKGVMVRRSESEFGVWREEGGGGEDLKRAAGREMSAGMSVGEEEEGEVILLCAVYLGGLWSGLAIDAGGGVVLQREHVLDQVCPRPAGLQDGRRDTRMRLRRTRRPVRWGSRRSGCQLRRRPPRPR